MGAMGDGLRLEEQLCFALYAASRAMTGAYARVLAELELTYPQYLAMLVLWETDGARVSLIGERLHLDSATVTPLLKRLESRGLVERRRSVEDERVVEVHLTGEGKRLRRKATEVPRAMVRCANMSLADLAALRGQLQELTSQLRRSMPDAE
jgi:MarR family transcriptional regulator, organic hydroperoxide resistance regulator